MVAVAYKRWSLTRDSKYNDLTWKHLVFYETGRWGEVVATGGPTLLVFSFLCVFMDLDYVLVHKHKKNLAVADPGFFF